MITLKTCPVCNAGNFENYLNCKDHFLTKEEFTIVTCASCHFRFINPQPSPDKLSNYYKSEDYISHHASRKGIFAAVYRVIRNHNFKKKISLLKRYSEGNSLLDIGCATGDFLRYARQNGYMVTGIEPDSEARRFAVENNGITVSDEEGIYRIETNSLDVVSMWHVLEHVPDLNGRIEQVSRILKTDGKLFVALPNCDSADAQLYKSFWAGYDVPRHLWHFNQSSVNTLFERHGYKLEKIVPMKFDSYYVSLLSEKYISGKRNIIKSIHNGCISNRYGKKNNLNYSSLIYILSKKTGI